MTSYSLTKVTKLSQNDNTYPRMLKFTTLFIMALILSELTNWFYFHSPVLATVLASRAIYLDMPNYICSRRSTLGGQV